MQNLTYKILEKHLLKGKLEAGQPIEIKMDQTLTQDATGTMAYMQFEAMGVKKVKTELSVSYVDHNTLQNGFMNADDHAYLQSVASKYGIYFSKAGNGICHQVHLERFAKPGKTLIGSDSHTPTSSAMGCIAIGAGGLDVAKAMAGIGYRLTCPKVVEVKLTGTLAHGVSSKDIILKLLELLSVKGGVGKVFEYTGEGVKNLSVYQRATITNMGAELGATTSIFPSDEVTREFLKRQQRESDYIALSADEGCHYDETVEINLDELTPLAACPNSPDAIKNVSELAGMKVDQVAIGSCTNSGYEDLMKAAAILKGKKIAHNVSLVVSPGSRQVLMKLIENGTLATFVSCGARILECTCGPCIGMGQSPKSDAVSLRTFNRNFEGRSGTKDGKIYLVSPEVAAASALTGYLTDPRDLGEAPNITMPEHFVVNDNMIEPPASPEEAASVEVLRGPNIKPFPKTEPLPESITAKAVLKVGDNITTDHIMPAGAKILPYRSNIPHLSQYCFGVCDETFPERIKAEGKGFIIGGSNYGQGSSREHAALVPLYLGVKAVITKSFARIHVANLVNAGILPFTFADESDYDKIDQMDELELADIRDCIKNNKPVVLKNITKDEEYNLDSSHLSDRQRAMLLCGGLLDYTREQNK